MENASALVTAVGSGLGNTSVMDVMYMNTSHDLNNYTQDYNNHTMDVVNSLRDWNHHTQGLDNYSQNMTNYTHKFNSTWTLLDQLELWDTGNANGSMNSMFFDTYFSVSRFAVESVMAVLALGINALALVSSAHARNKRYSIYHILFINLCVCNALSLSLSWISNNAIFLFSDQLSRMAEQENGLCKVFLYLTGAVYVCAAFSTVSIVTLLGFITVQYVAICRPLQHLTLVPRQRVVVGVSSTWVVCVGCGCCVPLLLLLFTQHAQACDARLLRLIGRVLGIGVNCFLALMAALYTLIVAAAARIYVQVRALQRRLSQFRYEQEVGGESKAFFTTLMLIALLTLFYVPYTSVYVYSLHNHGAASTAPLIYYMNLLPYVKFFLDPLIYGLRMREMREGAARVAAACGCSRWVAQDHVVLSRVTSDVSVRMRPHSASAAPQPVSPNARTTISM